MPVCTELACGWAMWPLCIAPDIHIWQWHAAELLIPGHVLAGIASLASAARLRHLSLRACRLTGQGLAALASSRHLRVLKLSSCLRLSRQGESFPCAYPPTAQLSTGICCCTCCRWRACFTDSSLIRV